MMHVLVVPSWYPVHEGDACGSFFREQAQALARHDCRVGVIYPQQRSLRQWRTLHRETYGLHEMLDEGVQTMRHFGLPWLPVPAIVRGYRWLQVGMYLYQHYVRAHGVPDLIHAQATLFAGVLAQRIHRRHKVPYVITEHSSAYARQLVLPWQRRMALPAVREADSRLAVSAPLANLLTDYFSPQAGHWQVMPNSVQAAFYRHPLPDRDVSTGRFEFLAVMAQITVNKGVEELIRAFALAFKGAAEVNLRIVGDGEERSRLHNLTEQLGLNEQIHFIGMLERSQVAEQMSMAHALVVASHYETFAVVITEALALGLPVVATRCGGPDGIVDEADGLLVPPGDIQTLADALQRVRSDYQQYDAAAIRRRCVERFGETVVTSRLKHVYQHLIGQ